MSRVVYVNGRYVPYGQAQIHVEDRGFQFADSVYEVCEVRAGRIIDETRHLARLNRSLSELRIAPPMSDACMKIVFSEVLRRNRVREGIIYLQVTRGVARRDFLFPDPPVAPTMVVLARSVPSTKGEATAQQGISVITLPENRWPRVDIKTTGLLPNVLAKMQAREKSAREAWFVDSAGYVTEGGSSNAWIVTTDGVLVTRPAESGILRGVTRTTLFDLARKDGLEVDERPFTVAEAKAAREAFISSATTIATPVVRIDDSPVGDGRPGPVVSALRRGFHLIAEWRVV